jgi:hypothetical protein
MDFNFSDQMIIAGGVICIVQALVLYLVINFATKADRRAKYEWAQMDLLTKIARVQGVPEQEIQKTLDAIK